CVRARVCVRVVRGGLFGQCSNSVCKPVTLQQKEVLNSLESLDSFSACCSSVSVRALCVCLCALCLFCSSCNSPLPLPPPNEGGVLVEFRVQRPTRQGDVPECVCALLRVFPCVCVCVCACA
uniref:Uncharacterized protein n=1 Tax=Anopheles arabiensis TaxID=7173 RepID=A0A182IHI6_ANOAR